ncbi:hypothetical protein RUM44_010199 [Polyplax serrata]|uniref:Uncharacterized protein n=1 Tax=Polyplax serrata TaxID=468196 RepID=A0ABR1AUU3_POLSC
MDVELCFVFAETGGRYQGVFPRVEDESSAFSFKVQKVRRSRGKLKILTTPDACACCFTPSGMTRFTGEIYSFVRWRRQPAVADRASDRESQKFLCPRAPGKEEEAGKK